MPHVAGALGPGVRTPKRQGSATSSARLARRYVRRTRTTVARLPWAAGGGQLLINFADLDTAGISRSPSTLPATSSTVLPSASLPGRSFV